MSQPVWRVAVSSEAQRGLHRLPEKVAAAIVEFITGPLADNPHRVSKDLTVRLAGYRSARRGDYRVVIKIVEVDQVVLVDRIDHRSNVYRPR
ncbi:MAG: type II toxin-antitoxin system RelE family toxin [Dermatophilaceae bacterium]